MTHLEELEREIDRILIDGHALLIPNYTPVLVREQIIHAFEKAGGVFWSPGKESDQNV